MYTKIINFEEKVLVYHKIEDEVEIENEETEENQDTENIETEEDQDIKDAETEVDKDTKDEETEVHKDSEDEEDQIPPSGNFTSNSTTARQVERIFCAIIEHGQLVLMINGKTLENLK
ncbi:Hypothetical protein CINCED_3A023032 [Cinara cedri]|uniref:Uncharacterized protein n=1 Tax=Cinara cedri TaxID=506608 RepID=A0A5E4NGP8_9HEMI|nr:Hypothetical protein CINCED_3A023032 [Cinara cedri]